MADKKLIASTVSSRNVGIKRRNEGMTVRSHEKTKIYKDQEDETMNGKGVGRNSNMWTVTFHCACEAKMKNVNSK